MNGNELVAEVLDWVTDVSFTADDALILLNRGQVAIASRLLLPGLSNGIDTVDTVPGQYAVAVPDDYMKVLYHAQTDNGNPTVYQNIALFMTDFPVIDDSPGTLAGVVVAGRQLVYQSVPTLAKTITLRYYRKPTPMTTRSDSYPDGYEFGSDVGENYEKALVHYAAKEIYAKIEQGDGNKEDTAYHTAEYNRHLATMKDGTPESRPHPKPPVCEANF